MDEMAAKFGSLAYEDVKGVLSKLTQRSSITQYPLQFEVLSNRTIGSLESFLLSYFILGLRLAIRRQVQINTLLVLMRTI